MLHFSRPPVSACVCVCVRASTRVSKRGRMCVQAVITSLLLLPLLLSQRKKKAAKEWRNGRGRSEWGLKWGRPGEVEAAAEDAALKTVSGRRGGLSSRALQLDCDLSFWRQRTSKRAHSKMPVHSRHMQKARVIIKSSLPFMTVSRQQVFRQKQKVIFFACNGAMLSTVCKKAPINGTTKNGTELVYLFPIGELNPLSNIIHE